MTSDDRFQRIREALASGRSEPLSDADVEEVEMLAALRDGTLDVEDAPEEVLGRAIGRVGRAAVAEDASGGAPEGAPLAEPSPRLRALPQQPHTGGFPWFRTPAFAAAAAVLLVGITALLAVRPGGAPEPSFDLARVDALVLPAGAATIDVALTSTRGAEPNWEVAMRGGSADPRLPASLRRHGVLVRAGSEFGNGVLLDGDGWIVVPSDLVAEWVQEAAWSGEIATVGVEVPEVSEDGVARGSDEALKARVMRHAPGLGLSLLRIEGGRAPDLEALEIAEAGPEDGEPLRFQGVIDPESQAGTAGERVGLGELLRGQRADAATRVAGDVVPIPGARFGRVSLGAPVFAGVESGSPALVGVVLGGDRGRTWCAPAESLRALLADPPAEPERHPVDPWVSPVGGARTTAAVEGEGLLTEVADRSDARTTSLFLGTVPPTADSVPAGLPGSPDAGDLPFDAFLTWDEAGRIAVGTTDGAGRVDRVAVGDRATGLARRIYTRTPDGSTFQLRAAGPDERVTDGLAP